MTTIIADRRDDGTVVLGWDSLATGDGDSYRTDKVHLINDQIWIGVAGDVRFANVIPYISVPRVDPELLMSEGFDPVRYLVDTVVPAWVVGLKVRFEGDPRHKEEWPDGGILVVLGGRLFLVDFDFSVVESARRWLGVGTGVRYALGALKMGATVREALEVACEFDLFTGEDLRVKVIN